MLPIPAKSMCCNGCVFLHQVFCVICLLRVHQADWIVNYMLSKIVCFSCLNSCFRLDVFARFLSKK